MSEVKTTWGMPSVATLFIVGSLIFGLFALLCGLVSLAAISTLCAWLIAGGVTVVICAVIEFVRGDTLLGTLSMVFGTLIALGGGVSFNTIAHLPPEAMPAGMAVSGWIWLAIGICLFLFLPSLGKISWSLFIMVLEIGVAIIMIAVGLMMGVPLGQGIMFVAGILAIIFALYLLYAGTAFLTNTIYRAPKLSIGGPLFK